MFTSPKQSIKIKKFNNTTIKYYKLKIEIIDNKVSVLLLDKKKNIISKSSWTDKRSLTERLLGKIDLLLRKNKISLNDISKFDFASSGKCGFTAQQVGEITAKVLNMNYKNYF